MNMQCDVYTQQNSQTSSGAIQRTWVYHTTIDCRIEPLKAGKSVSTSDNKSFDKEYEENLELKIKSVFLASQVVELRKKLEQEKIEQEKLYL